MNGIINLEWFVLAGLALNLTPGPDFTFIAGWSLRRGVRAGVVAALGIGSGCLVHVAAAAFGLSALLAASSHAMTFIRYVGGAYLLWLGVMMIVQATRAPLATTTQTGAMLPSNAPASAALSARAPLRRIFAQGMLTNVLNPKIALFFLAFLPQFVDPAASAKVSAMLILGAVFTFNGTVCCVAFAWLAGRLATRLRGTRAASWLVGLLGAALALFGLKLIV